MRRETLNSNLLKSEKNDLESHPAYMKVLVNIFIDILKLFLFDNHVPVFPSKKIKWKTDKSRPPIKKSELKIPKKSNTKI